MNDGFTVGRLVPMSGQMTDRQIIDALEMRLTRAENDAAALARRVAAIEAARQLSGALGEPVWGAGQTMDDDLPHGGKPPPKEGF